MPDARTKQAAAHYLEVAAGRCGLGSSDAVSSGRTALTERLARAPLAP